MIFFKKLCKMCLFPPRPLALLFAAASAVGLTAVFSKGLDKSIVAYVIYAFSFYTLTVITIDLVLHFPPFVRNFKSKVYATKLGNRYMTDPIFKTRVSLYRSFTVNLLYALFNFVSALYYKTAWFMLFACYYAIMAVMRFLLINYTNKNGIGKNRLAELKRARLCACILLTVNLALSGAVLMMIYFGRGFEYKGMLIYIMAVYAFYITTAAIINMAKYKKYHSPVMSMAKTVNFAAALTTMLALETAMLSQFGNGSSENYAVMITATGIGICLVIFVISVYIIKKTSKEINILTKH